MLGIDYKISHLKNGLEVITIKKDSGLASVNLGIKNGSIYEGETKRGISHFIEHLLFKGTKHRNNEVLNNDLENLGGEYNAYTDLTATVYTITCLVEEIKNAVEILSDMAINSIFPEEEVEKERGVIISEIKSGKDDIEDISFKRVNEAAYNISPLKYEVIGTEESVSSFNRDEIYEYYKNEYTPKNAVISFVSPYSHDEAIEIIKDKFELWEGNEVNHKEIVKEKNKDIICTTIKKDIEQNTLTYLYNFYDLDRDKELSLKILNHKLGESANSILFRELREKSGLVYDIYTQLDLSKDIKSLYIYTACGEENVEKAQELIDKCIEDIKYRKYTFDEDTFKIMKKVHKTAVVSTLEDSSELCSYALHQRLENEDILEFLTDMEKLKELKIEELYEVAEEVLNNPTIHILKNEEDI